MMLFHKKGEPLTGWKHKFVTLGNHLVAKNILFMFGCWSIDNSNVIMDYKEYLGPDWKPTYKGASTIISNHSCVLDIVCHMYRQAPSHVSKAAVKNLPFVGTIATAVGCLYIDRFDEGARKDMITQVKDRQILCEKGIYPPLIIYPEGGTTNGTHLLQFKSGAFLGLNSIKPVLISYWSPFLDIENCVYNFLA
jgi:lysophosphatidylcholine acyltransferase/lyso-PAF acetyltransferase